MNKLLIVCGPTATGKTALALHMARKFNGELISVDSRQVYIGMDIGTGKDLPVNSKIKKLKIGARKFGFYLIDGIKLWGYDLVDPKESFSVSEYVSIIEKIIKDILDRNKIPILVGGTGLYIKGIVDGIGTANIPPNFELRKSFEGKNAKELFEILSVNDPLKAASMNISDKMNPRRLVRAIEVAKSNHKHVSQIEKYNSLHIGLTLSKTQLEQKIMLRVDQRVEKGQEEELKSLLSKGIAWEMQSMQALGYREWKGFLEGVRSRAEVINLWKTNEIKYSKRQLTWFKKDSRINWFDVSNQNMKFDVEKLVEKWHNE